MVLSWMSQGGSADALALYFGEDPARVPFEQGNISMQTQQPILVSFSFCPWLDLRETTSLCFDSESAVVSTLHNFVRIFVRSHEENCKQVEFEKKRAQKEAENEKLKKDVYNVN